MTGVAVRSGEWFLRSLQISLKMMMHVSLQLQFRDLIGIHLDAAPLLDDECNVLIAVTVLPTVVTEYVGLPHLWWCLMNPVIEFSRIVTEFVTLVLVDTHTEFSASKQAKKGSHKKRGVDWERDGNRLLCRSAGHRFMTCMIRLPNTSPYSRRVWCSCALHTALLCERYAASHRLISAGLTMRKPLSKGLSHCLRRESLVGMAKRNCAKCQTQNLEVGDHFVLWVAPPFHACDQLGWSCDCVTMHVDVLWKAFFMKALSPVKVVEKTAFCSTTWRSSEQHVRERVWRSVARNCCSTQELWVPRRKNHDHLRQNASVARECCSTRRSWSAMLISPRTCTPISGYLAARLFSKDLVRTRRRTSVWKFVVIELILHLHASFFEVAILHRHRFVPIQISIELIVMTPSSVALLMTDVCREGQQWTHSLSCWVLCGRDLESVQLLESVNVKIKQFSHPYCCNIVRFLRQFGWKFGFDYETTLNSCGWSVFLAI